MTADNGDFFGLQNVTEMLSDAKTATKKDLLCSIVETLGVTFYFTVCVLIQESTCSITYLNQSRFGLGVGSGLVLSYYPDIVINIISI